MIFEMLICGGTKMKGHIDSRSEKRRGVKKIGSTEISLFLFLVALVIFGMNAEIGAAEKGPIKIGFITPLTGNWVRWARKWSRVLKCFWMRSIMRLPAEK